MKRLVLGFGLSLLLFSILTNAQDNKPSGNESSAVRTTVRDYIEAYYTGDSHRMEQTLHPHYLKHMIHGNIPMRENCFADGAGSTLPGPGRHPPSGADRTDKRAGRFGRHRLRQTYYSTLGGLLDALEIGWTVEDSLSCPANRQLGEGQCGDPDCVMAVVVVNKAITLITRQRAKLVNNRSHQLAAICMATIARTTPAVNVIIATHSIGRSAYMAASPCRVRCSSGMLLQLRRSVTQPVTSTASGRVTSRAQSVHILAAYHITIRPAVCAGSCCSGDTCRATSAPMKRMAGNMSSSCAAATARLAFISLSPREIFDECVSNEKGSEQTCNGENDDAEQVCCDVDTQGRRLTF